MVRERTEASAIRNLVSPASLTPKGFATTERDRMRALTVEPGRAHSACVEDVPEPGREDGAVLVRTLSVGICGTDADIVAGHRSEEHTSELQSLMRISYAVFCLKKTQETN